jgi:hypothetical protein
VRLGGVVLLWELRYSVDASVDRRLPLPELASLSGALLAGGCGCFPCFSNSFEPRAWLFRGSLQYELGRLCEVSSLERDLLLALLGVALSSVCW